MAERKNFNTAKVLRTNMAFPQAVIAGDLIFLSGTSGVDTATGKVVQNDFEAQALQAFKNVQTILEEAGSSKEKIIKTVIYMVAGCDPDFKIINKVYTDFFGENAPIRSAPQVMPFPGGLLISVECIAQV